MLGDSKLNSLDTRLEQFKLSNTNTQHELQALLKEYSHLLEDYKALRNASESGAKSRSDGASTTASTPSVPEKPRSPYVLVLVDGNGYIFNDELVKDKEEGGMRAARMLSDVVEKYLRELPQARDARVVVRIYADVTTLSKQLAKSRLVGLEKRSLMPFVAGFTRAIGGFDFVDAMDGEGTRFKIRETFKLAAEDNACTHILFAGCHDTSYMPLLAPYNNLQTKITLVQGAGFDTEFYQNGLNIAQFPTIFRWSELTSTSAPSPNKVPTKAPTPLRGASRLLAMEQDNWRQSPVTADSSTNDSNGGIGGIQDFTSGSHGAQKEGIKKNKQCRYFQKGFCRWGNKCNFVHVPDNLVTGSQNPSCAAQIDRSNISSYLPTSVPPGFIALNKDGHRLDMLVSAPTAEEWVIYNARFHKQKPCNAHHLSGACTNINCPFDHHPLEVESQHCLEYVLKCSPCPRKGACRDKDCFHGHICQKDGCIGQLKGCKLKADAHTADPKLASMVPAVVDADDVLGAASIVPPMISFDDLPAADTFGGGEYEAAW